MKGLTGFFRWRAGAAVGFEPLVTLLVALALWGEVLEGWTRSGAAVTAEVDPPAIFLEALGKVLEALSGSALLALWGEREVVEGWSKLTNVS